MSAIVGYIGIACCLTGSIILIVRQHLEKKHVCRSISPDEFASLDNETKDKIKPLRIKEGIHVPSLETINGGIIGENMFGKFARKGAPYYAVASYNCFFILYCAIIPLGCYLVDPMLDSRRIRYYCKLEMEKDELIFILSRGWGRLFLVIGALMYLGSLV